MFLINTLTKEVVKQGDILTDFRGKKARLTRWQLPTHPGSSGRVMVEAVDNQMAGSFYPAVFNLEFVEKVPAVMPTIADLHTAYGGVWGEHTEYSTQDWRREVEENSTRLGYWEWVIAQIEAAG